MKLKSVHFIHPVSFHGTITSANGTTASDPTRPGSTPFVITLDEHNGFPAVRLAKMHNGVEVHTLIPLTNVANYTPAPEEAKATPAPQAQGKKP